MMPDDLDDLMSRTLQGLPVFEPDPARRERIRARCRTKLAARQRRVDGRPPTKGQALLALERAVVVGFGATYLAAIILDVLAIEALR